MKKVRTVLGLWLVLGQLGAGAFAQEALHSFSPLDLSPTDRCVIPKIDGERVPFPLKAANSKFELAGGETYILNGTLTTSNNKVYLKVDFDSQPWLETDKMRAHPYFEITTMNPSQVGQYKGELVQVAVVASREGGSYASSFSQDLKLSPILPPVLTTR